MPGTSSTITISSTSSGLSIERKRLRTSMSSKRPLFSSFVRDLVEQRVGGGLADDVADNGEDVGVGRGVVAVDADFADHTGRGLRVRHRRAAEDDQQRARIT